jgi:Domain of unknown function (DUF4177)
MPAQYEYKFLRLEEGWFGGPSASAQENYQDVVHEHARQGWRLVQIFAPGTATYGHAAFYEVIFERPLAQHTG